MNEGHHLNNDEKHNDFSLVIRPSSAVEKVAPGAKRILSGMVADTLALAKKEQTEATISVTMCGWADPFVQQMVEMLLRQGLTTQSSIEFKFFFWTTDFLEAARHSRFDLLILWLNPGIYTRKDSAKCPLGREANWQDHGDEVDAYELIAGLKREFNRPVIAVTNGLKYESKSELEKAGSDAVFGMPFGISEFVSALQRCLRPVELVAQSRETRPIRIKTPTRRGKLLIVDGNEGPRESLRVILKDEYDLFLAEDGVKAVELSMQHDIDVVVLDTLAGMGLSGIKVLERLKILKPDIEVIMMTAFETSDLMREALRLGACDFIIKPFVIATIRSAVSKAMARKGDKSSGLDTRLEPEQKVPGPAANAARNRPLRIVSVDDDDWRLELVEMGISAFSKDVTVESFRDAEEAWQELSRADPDLLITDDIMGNLNGDEIVRRLAGRKAAYPIIVIQGYPMRDQWVLDCAARGENVTLLRAPYDLEGFVRAMESALRIPRDMKAPVEIAPQPRKARPLKIVMVNDEPFVLQAFEIMLRTWLKDVTFLMYASGVEAWQELSKRDPDLLITDHAMPGMHGRELCQRLLDRKVSYPIIVDDPWEPGVQWVQELANRGLNISYLPSPRTVENLRHLVEASGLRIPSG